MRGGHDGHVAVARRQGRHGTHHGRGQRRGDLQLPLLLLLLLLNTRGTVEYGGHARMFGSGTETRASGASSSSASSSSPSAGGRSATSASASASSSGTDGPSDGGRFEVQSLSGRAGSLGVHQVGGRSGGGEAAGRRQVAPSSDLLHLREQLELRQQVLLRGIVGVVVLLTTMSVGRHMQVRMQVRGSVGLLRGRLRLRRNARR